MVGSLQRRNEFGLLPEHSIVKSATLRLNVGGVLPEKGTLLWRRNSIGFTAGPPLVETYRSVLESLLAGPCNRADEK
jgi:hypothetical protein